MADLVNITLEPTSERYLEVIETEKLAFLIVDVLLTVVILVLFGEECYFVVKTYKHYDIAVKSVWLISIYPVFALSALLAVIIPRATYICDFVSTCYLSACLFQFSSLLLLYFGHVDHLLYKVGDTGFSLRACPCCCCLCFPVLPPTKKSLIIVRVMIFQTAVLQPIIQFISAVLWADGKFRAYGMDFSQSYVYLTILKLTSTILAMYGLNALHQSTQPHLLTHSTKPKRLALQLVLIFFNIQASILSIPTRFAAPPVKNGLSSHFQMNQWHHLFLVVEMFLLSMLARIYYRRPLTLDAALETRSGNLEDIYTPDIPPIEIEVDPIPTKALPGTAPLPEHDNHAYDNRENILASPSFNHAPGNQINSVVPEVSEVSTTDLTIQSEEVHLIDENDTGDAVEILNPVFDDETADDDKEEPQKITAAISEMKKYGTIPRSEEEAPYDDGTKATREEEAPYDAGTIPTSDDEWQSTDHTETVESDSSSEDVLGDISGHEFYHRTTKTPSYNCLTATNESPETFNTRL